METKPLPVSANVSPLVLYYEDLEFFMNLLGSTERTVILRLNDQQNEYTFVSVKELSALKDLPTERFNNLSITCPNPYLTLDLWKDGGSIRISEDTPTLRGLMEKIKDRLKLRRKKLFWIYTPRWSFFVPTLSAYWGSWELTHQNHIMGAMIVLMSCGWYGLSWYLKFYNYTVIFTKTKKELPSFFQRKSDDIYISIISIFVSVILGALITKWVGS